MKKSGTILPVGVQREQPAHSTLVVGPVFFLSGCSALIYQVAWQRLLALYYGVGPLSIALIVSIFMLGLGVGGLAGGRIAERLSNPARSYCLIELTLGAFGSASVAALDLLGRATAAGSYPIAALVCAAFLLVPTLLTGATLPVGLRWYRSYRSDYLESLSLLYLANTLGAAIGSLMAAYVLISFVGIQGAVYAAAVVNVTLAAAVAVAARRLPLPPVDPPCRGSNHELLGARALVLVFVTGFLAIGYEILWFLNLQQILKDSPYAFATILFVYLPRARARKPRDESAGETDGGGGSEGTVLPDPARDRPVRGPDADRVPVRPGSHVSRRPGPTDGQLQGAPPAVDFQAGLRAMWETWGSAQGVYKLTDTLFWPVLFVLMPTVLMGASFPLAAYLANGDDSPRETRGTGALYVWNVIGNVLGAAVTAFFLIPRIGSEATFLLFCLAGTAFGVGVTRLFRRRVPLGIRAVGSSSSW